MSIRDDLDLAILDYRTGQLPAEVTDAYDRIQSALDTLERELAAARRALERCADNETNGWRHCCVSLVPDAHEPDCWLAAAIAPTS